MARDTEAVETPACRATSRMPTLLGFIAETVYKKRYAARHRRFRGKTPMKRLCR
jgi:hypothetical protein